MGNMVNCFVRKLNPFFLEINNPLHIYFCKGAVCLLGALSSLCSSLWHNAAEHEQKASSAVDFKESRFLSGSAYLSGSFTVVTEADNKHYYKKENTARETTNVQNSVESLFIDKHPLQDDIDYKAIRWTLTHTEEDITQRSSEHHSRQPRGYLPLQIQEIRLLPTDSDS